MKFPDPTYHFPNFNVDWAGLTWTMDSNDYLDVAEVANVDFKHGG